MTKIILTVNLPDIFREVLDPDILSEILVERVEEIVQERIQEDIAAVVANGSDMNEDEDDYDIQEREEAILEALDSIEINSETL